MSKGVAEPSVRRMCANPHMEINTPTLSQTHSPCKPNTTNTRPSSPNNHDSDKKSGLFHEFSPLLNQYALRCRTAPQPSPLHVVQAHHRLTLSPSLIHTEETTHRWTSSLYASTVLLATLALLWIHCTPVLTLCTMYYPMLLHTLSHRQRSWRVSSSVAFYGP